VAFPGPGAGGNFLEQILGDLLQLMGGTSPGGARIDLARTLAQGVASGGEPERNVDPADRMKFEELAHIAELHVTEITGLPITPSGANLEIAAVAPGAWAWQTVEDWRFLLEAMAEPAPPVETKDGVSGAKPSPPEKDRPAAKGTLGYVDTGRDPDMPADFPTPLDFDLPDFDPQGFDTQGFDPGTVAGGESGPADLLARWMATMGPLLAAMQLGSAVGHLARSTLGPYELPIPRSTPRLLVVPANAARFAEDWSLDLDEVRLWVCLRELTAHAVLSRPHVAERVRELLVRVVQGMAEDTAGLVDNLQGIDLTQPEALQSLLGDPTALMSLEPSPARRRAAEDLVAVVAALLGYIEHVLDQAALRLLGGRGAIAEAWRRRQVDRESSERAAELMLGLDLGPAQIDRGADFIRGVFERAGEDGLARLWSGPHTLPTPAEIDAPGLWLERIDLPEPDANNR
jgi:putative hydrolase